jgi:hypothetical protein
MKVKSTIMMGKVWTERIIVIYIKQVDLMFLIINLNRDHHSEKHQDSDGRISHARVRAWKGSHLIITNRPHRD